MDSLSTASYAQLNTFAQAGILSADEGAQVLNLSLAQSSAAAPPLLNPWSTDAVVLGGALVAQLLSADGSAALPYLPPAVPAPVPPLGQNVDVLA